MAIYLPPLDSRQSIVAEDGKPSLYFLKYLRDRGGFLTEIEAALIAKADKTTLISTSGGLQGGGDLSANRTLSLTDTGVTPGSYSNADVTVDIKGRITSIADGGGGAYYVPFGFTDAPLATEIMLLHTFPVAVDFPDDFVGSVGVCGTNPTATATLTVYRAGVSVGTISVSTTGVFTFSTSGTGLLSFTAGQELKITAQASPDATFANTSVTLKGTLA